jgi:hypothetical protein
MAVAGRDCTIIAKSGHYASVTPFSADLPVMERVEIGDVAIAYDDPYSLETYLLVMRNVLLIPSMDHNLLPPFLVREASLFLDETPKFQSTDVSLENHTIYDEVTGLRIHLQLNGTFSYFVSRSLTLEEQEHWENYPVVHLTPDSDQWDPHALHFAEAEAAMLDSSGEIVGQRKRNRNLFEEADISVLYAEPCTWDSLEELIDNQLSDVYDLSDPLSEDDEVMLTCDGIRAQIASLNTVFEPPIFSAVLIDQALISKVSMAMGSMTVDDAACGVFEARVFSSLSAIAAGRSKGVTAEHLVKIWRIPYDDAARTLEVTTQRIRQDPDSSLSRNARTNDRAVRYRRISSKFFTDTLFATKMAKSLRGNTCAQIFVSDKDFIALYPMKKEAEYFLALQEFSKDVGAPDVLVCDSAKTQKKREVKDFCTQIGTTLNILEAETQWANRSELWVGLVKESTRKDLRDSGSPIVLWDYCMERRVLIYQVTAKKLFQLHGMNPHTATFGTQADISNLCLFGWYEWVYYREQQAPYPFQKECLGRCLGPAKNEGNVMANWILTQKGTVIPRRSIRRLTADERSDSNEVEAQKRVSFNADITAKLGDSVKLPSNPLPDWVEPDWDSEPYGDDTTSEHEPFEADLVDAAGKPILMHSLTDVLINAEVLLSKDDSTALARVIRRAVDSNGKVIGEWDSNPILNTLVYECEFNDGTIKEYSANVIASNIYEEGDADGFSSSLLYKIVDHKSSGEAIKMADKYITTRTGTRRMRQTTVGWSFLVKWGDGSQQWIDLKILKESNPVQVGAYVIARGIQDEPAFAWWVPYVMRKRDIIVSMVKSRVRRTTHKYGIEMPAPGRDIVQNAIDLDRKNGDTFWMDSLAKEMRNLNCIRIP